MKALCKRKDYDEKNKLAKLKFENRNKKTHPGNGHVKPGKPLDTLEEKRGR